MEEMKSRLEFNEYVQLQVGPVLLGVPVGVAYALAIELHQSLLTRYEVAPGVPTPDEPQPPPYLVLKEEPIEEDTGE